MTYKSFEGKDLEIKYDKLIIAVGGVPNTYNIPGVSNHCMFLKNIEGINYKHLKK